MTRRPAHPRRYSARQRGSVYVIVLATAMLLVVISVGAAVTTRAKHRTANLNNDAAQARYHARSAVELVLFYMRTDPNWRTNRSSGTWATGYPVGSGSFDVAVTDPDDGNLADDENDDALVTATAYSGSARHKLAVRLRPYVSRAMDCLHTAACAEGAIVNYDALTSNAAVATNGNFYNYGAISGGGVEVSGSYANYGSVSNAWIVTSAPLREVPAITTVINDYTASATDINFLLLPLGSGLGRRMRDVLLTPASNPYGLFTNPNGVYRIDCMGQDIEIRDCRIVGTLILINPGSNSKIDDGCLMEPTRADYPALLVRGNFKIAIDSNLSESASGRNFNPASAPYNGLSDADAFDTYTSVIRGLVAVSGNLMIESDTRIFGTAVAGGYIRFSGNVNLAHNPQILDNPPAGFERLTRYMSVVPGTWQRLVD